MNAIHSLATSDWLLAQCQDRVAETEPNPYYLSAYRAAERAYWSLIPEWMREAALQTTPRSCLDVGCAYGTLLLYAQRLTRCEIYGLDFLDCYLSPALIDAANIRFAVGNIELDPLPWAHRFDWIIFTEVLEHLNFQPVPTLLKLSAALTEGGRLYLSTPDAAHWGSTFKYYRHFADIPWPDASLRAGIIDDHVWQYSADELHDIIRAAGLRIIRTGYSPGIGARHFNVVLGHGDGR
jgi:SAM-dependent methyltransferase